jgi:hypothetical protein
MSTSSYKRDSSKESLDDSPSAAIAEQLANATKPQLAALIFALHVLPLHTRHGLKELLQTGRAYCLPFWIYVALNEQKLLLQEVIALGDEHGRSQLLRIVSSFHPTFNGHIGEPIRTIWGYPFLPENWKE